MADVLERTGLTGRADRLVKVCSGGEQQRLRFALALLADPDLLLLDEPTAGMDVEARQTFWAAMNTEADRGRTIVFATHYLQEAEDFARRTVLLDRRPDRGRRPHRSDPQSGRRPDRPGPGGTSHRIDHAADMVRLMPEVRRVAVDGNRLTVETAESDAVAAVLIRDFGGTDLEIEAASLERAFVALTNRPD